MRGSNDRSLRNGRLAGDTSSAGRWLVGIISGSTPRPTLSDLENIVQI